MTALPYEIITINQPEIVDFSKVRNHYLKKSQKDWILFLDKDEELTPELKNEISEAISHDNADAFYIPRLDIFLNKELHFGETGNAKFIRLAKADFGEWSRPVHEVWMPYSKDKVISTLKNPLIHNPHPDIASFLNKINRYTELESRYRYAEGRKSSIIRILINPLSKFILNFIIKQGFRDGMPGLIMCMMMSYHSFLTWTKLYILCRKK